MNQNEAVRIFKSDFLEFFTHIHPLQVAVAWGLLDIYFLYRSVNAAASVPAGAAVLPAVFVVGLLFWTFSEYALHRWLFHFRPRTPFQERMSFMFHGVHHAQPMVKTRLVMPFPLSVPLAALFLLFFHLVTGILLGRQALIFPLFAGFITGYLAYDIGHYSFHHFRTKNPYLLYLRKHHMRHHGADSGMRFGVSSPIWDYVFHTMPVKSPTTGQADSEAL